MKIFTYECPDAPAGNRFVGRILIKGGFLPCLASADTKEAVEEKLRKMWSNSTEAKLRKKGQLHPVSEEVVQTEPLESAAPAIELDLGL